jgi:hypothetical protein
VPLLEDAQKSLIEDEIAHLGPESALQLTITSALSVPSGWRHHSFIPPHLAGAVRDSCA